MQRVLTYMTASSTGLLLKAQGLKVSSIKIDPYLNVDAGTMNPKEYEANQTLRRDLTLAYGFQAW